MSTDRERYDDLGKKKRESDEASQTMGKRQIIEHPDGHLNTRTPCAACKLLRRRCAEECPFSPYFSPHEPQKFAAVHKVFGASNVSKMLMEVPESQRVDAANSLVYEANLRIRDPVHGCKSAISTLQAQIHTLQAELLAVRTEILKYKFREGAPTNIVVSTSSQYTSVSPTMVSVAIPPSTLHPPNAAPIPPPQLPSSVVVSSSACSSSATSLFTSSVTATDQCSSLSSGDVQYFS